MQHTNELSKSLGSPDITKSIHLFRLQEKQYNKLLEQRSEVKATANKKKYKEVQEEIQDLSRSIKESTNTLTRSLKENPAISSNMSKVNRDRNDLRDLLLRCTQELRDHRTFKTILVKVEEENRIQARLRDLKTNEKILRDTVYSLQQQLIDEQTDLSNVIQDKRTEISQLRAEIRAIKTTASLNSNFKRKESHAHVAAIWREYKLQQREMEIKLKDYDSQMKTEDIVYSETKDFLSRKTISLVNDLKKWDIKYEKDIGEIDEKIRKATHERNKLVEKLYVLQDRKEIEIKEEKEMIIKTAQESKLSLQNESVGMRQNIAARKIQNMLKLYIRHQKARAGNTKAKSGKKKEGDAKGGKKKKK